MLVQYHITMDNVRGCHLKLKTHRDIYQYVPLHQTTICSQERFNLQTDSRSNYNVFAAITLQKT